MTPSRSPTRSRCSYPTSEESLKPAVSLGSSIRSAAQATYSAYKRQPIRWRLAGGSAALTLVILLGFAVIVGTLTTRAIYKDFNRQVAATADRLQQKLVYTYTGQDAKGDPQFERKIDLNAYASPSGAINVLYSDGRKFDGSDNGPAWGKPNTSQEPDVVDGWHIETREIHLYDSDFRQWYTAWIQYGRRLSD